jgi:hypothetical protein
VHIAEALTALTLPHAVHSFEVGSFLFVDEILISGRGMQAPPSSASVQEQWQ